MHAALHDKRVIARDLRQAASPSGASQAMFSEPLTTLLIALAATLLLFVAMWLVSLRTRDVGAVDIIWGPGFALIAWIEWVSLKPQGAAATVLLLCVTLWAVRLGVHLFSRHRLSNVEDARYAAMRAANPSGFPLASLGKVFILQALILFALALPIHAAMVRGGGGLGLIGGAGLALFFGGLALETWADRMLLDLRRDPARRGDLLTTGPFAWSRHPNYFGECVLWFGLGLMAWDASGAWWVMLGPAALTALILKVSGPPLLEAHMAATRPGYAAYAARTSRFVPWPPRKDV
jgi:steroid 5-alpha reductase family enzyme